jgi:hypothetical protein
MHCWGLSLLASWKGSVCRVNPILLRAINDLRSRAFWRATWVMWALMAIAVVYFGAITLMHTPATSPIDEWVYLDYLFAIPQRGMVFAGQVVGPETLSLLSCHGTSPFGPIGTPCGQTAVLADFPNQGKTTASVYTPIYFYVTYGLGWLVSHVLPVGELAGWRLSGLAWALAGLVIFVKLLRAWRARDLTIFALGLAFIASPFAWWSFTYVSTDAPVFFFGALLMLLATRYVRRETPGWLFTVVALVAVLFKSVVIIGVAAAGLYLVAEFIGGVSRRRSGVPAHSGEERSGESRRPQWRLVITAGIALGGSLATAWLWNRLSALLAVSDQLADQGIATPLTIPEILMQFTNFLPQAITAGAINAYIPTFAYAPLGWLTVVCVLGAAFVATRNDRWVPLVSSVVTAAALAAPAFALMLVATIGTYYQIPSRYGAVLIPAFLLCGALILRNRWVNGFIIAFAVSLLGLGIWLAVYLATLAP